MIINRHFSSLILLFLLLCGTVVYAQDPPNRGSVIIESKIDTSITREVDTLITKEITFSEKINDTVKNDTVLPKKKKDLLTD
ncbi:MAG: hypothetical protein JKY22_07345, partial [Flavobacteriaceae bacterium]|nr:hypothetical protein [Flavobacteriaceae bacterium]